MFGWMNGGKCAGVVMTVLVASTGCKKSGQAQPADLGQQPDAMSQEQLLESAKVEATEEIKLEDMPTLLEGAQIKLPHPIYEVRYRATEDGTTRAWIEINDLRKSEYEALFEHTSQFEGGQIIVPPQAPGIPKRVAQYETYTIASADGQAPFSARAVGFTHFKGPSEDHFVSVAVPEQKLTEEGYYLAVVGEHEALSLTQPATKSLEGASGERVLEQMHDYLERTLRPKELEALPASLTPGDVQIIEGSWLKGMHASLAVLDIVLDSSDEAADHISAMMFLNERGEVSGLVEAPAKRTETFQVKGVIKLSPDDPGYLVYENLQYEGAYTYLLIIDAKNKTGLVMLNGDGL